MPAVKPPEWDAMSANEQLLWYLKRLCAKAEEMSLALGVASVGDLPVVTPLVDPAASTMTHTSATPVPDVSCSNTKAQEVLKVIHDAPPACVTMAHTTCSTDGSNKVVAINSVNKVTITFPGLAIDLNTTTAVLPELAVVRNDKEVEQLPSHAVTEEDATPGAITTDALAQLGSPVTTVAYNGVVIIDANNCVAPALTMCSMECSSRDVVAVMPALAAAATPESSSTIVEFVPELTDCDADVQTFDIGANGVAAHTPTRCSTDCLSDNLNQGSEVLLMSWCVFGNSHGGGCWMHPWPPPQVMSLKGICGTAPIPTEQHFCSQLLFHSDQSGGSSCMTWEPGGLLNCTLLSHKANDQVFGYKNASIQSLLRQLLVDSTGIRIDTSSPKNYGPASHSTDTVAADVSDDYEQHHVSLDKVVVTAKRSLNLIKEEGVAKRSHNQDVVTSIDNSARQSFNMGDPGNCSQLCFVSTSTCMLPLLEEMPCEFPDDMHLKYAGPVLQVTPVIKHFTCDLNFPRESRSQRILQLMENLNSSATQWRLSILAELQGYGIHGDDNERQPKPRQLFKFSQEIIQLKPPWPSFSCNCREVQFLSMSMHWKFLNHEVFKGSGRCRPEKSSIVPGARILLVVLIFPFKFQPDWILLARPTAQERT